jgi:hypothetical protein
VLQILFRMVKTKSGRVVKKPVVKYDQKSVMNATACKNYKAKKKIGGEEKGQNGRGENEEKEKINGKELPKPDMEFCLIATKMHKFVYVICKIKCSCSMEFFQ